MVKELRADAGVGGLKYRESQEWVTLVRASVKTDPIVHLRSVHFTPSKLYLNE